MNLVRIARPRVASALLALAVALTIASSIIAIMWRANADGRARIVTIDEIPHAPGSTEGSLDYVADRGRFIAHPSPSVISSVARRNPSVILNGWAIDSPAARLAAGVYAVVDDDEMYRAEYGLPRRDVADTLGDPKFTYSGFQVAIPSRMLRGGSHRIEIRVIANDASGYYVLGPGFDVDL